MSVRVAALWSMGSQYTAFIIQFTTSVLISRLFLTPEEVGLFSVALAATQLLAVLQEFGLTRYIAGQEKLDRDHLQTCASVALVFAWGVAAFVALLAWPMAHLYDNPGIVPLMLILAASYLFVPFSVVPSAVLTRSMDFKSLFMVNAGSALITGVIALGLAWLGFSAAALAWAVVAQAVTKALIAQWRQSVPLPFPIRMKGALPVMKFGSAASVLYISGAIGTRSPDLIIGRLITMEAVGLFSRATALAGQLMVLVAGAVGGVFYPAFARMRDRGEDLAPAYLRITAAYTAIVWPTMIGLAVASQPLVLAIYGPRWSDVGPLLMWIAISEIFFMMLPMTMELPMLTGRMRKLLVLNLTDTAASISFLAAGALWGVEAAAQSRIAYGAVWVIIYARFLQDIVGFSWGRMLVIYAQSAAVTVAAMLPLGLLYMFVAGPHDMPFWLLALGALAGMACWLPCLWLVRHPAREEIVKTLAPLTGRIMPMLVKAKPS